MTDYVEKALEIATAAHAGQVDKAGVAYIQHTKTVASFVQRPEEKATAYLHDVLEDTKWTVQDLRAAGIPEAVVEAVVTLTKAEGEDYFDYLTKVKANPISRIVKLADLKHNSDLSRLDQLTAKDQERLEKYEKATAFLKAKLEQD